MDGVWVLADVMPLKNAATGDHRIGDGGIRVEVREVDAVAHPLAGDAAGKVTENAELEISPGIEGAVGLSQEPPVPVGLALPDRRHVRILGIVPTVVVVSPDLLDFGYMAQLARPHEVPHTDLIGIAQPLDAVLHDLIGFEDRGARELGFFHIERHWLLDVTVLAGGDDFRQQFSMLVIARGDHDGIHLGELQHLLGILVLLYLGIESFPAVRRRLLAVHRPDVAHGHDPQVFIFEGHFDHAPVACAAGATAEEADVDPVVCSRDPAVGSRSDRGRHCACSRLLDKASSIESSHHKPTLSTIITAQNAACRKLQPS